AEEKLRLGLRIYIREGSAAKNLEALLPAVTDANASRFSFCTDDRHPADLMEQGHIDHAVRKAVRLGMDPVRAITLGSFNTAQHSGRRDLGGVAPAYLADLIVFEDLRDIRPTDVWFHGVQTVREGAYVARVPGREPVAAGRDGVHLPADLSEASMRMPAKA